MGFGGCMLLPKLVIAADSLHAKKIFLRWSLVAGLVIAAVGVKAQRPELANAVKDDKPY